MPEFFIVANSFAAPIVSDQSTHYAEGLELGCRLGRLQGDVQPSRGLSTHDIRR
jgi:hypothetical protein